MSLDVKWGTEKQEEVNNFFEVTQQICGRETQAPWGHNFMALLLNIYI